MSDGNEGRLTLVGLGLEAGGLSTAGLEAAKRAESVFLEAYTAKAPQSVEELEALVENEIEPVERARVEEGTVLLQAAQNGGACLLVAGDPLSATTHTSLRVQARRADVEVRVHHAGSVLTAVPAALGLSHYKFGRTTTLVTPQENYFPDSPYDVIAGNLERDLHTLVLLDVRADGSVMTAAEGAGVLARLEDERGEGWLSPQRTLLVVARAGTREEAAWRGTVESLKGLEAGDPMHSLVVPGPLGPVEQEALEVSVTER